MVRSSVSKRKVSGTTKTDSSTSSLRDNIRALILDSYSLGATLELQREQNKLMQTFVKVKEEASSKE